MNRRWSVYAVAAAGFVILTAATWRVVSTPGAGAALAVLVITGGVLLISPFVLPYLQAIAVNTDGFELRLVREIAEHGAPGAARLLNHTELPAIAEAYGVVHSQLAGDEFKAARTQIQDQLVDRASAFARQRKFDPTEIRNLFPQATGPVRVLLLGLMKGDPRLVDAETLASAIIRPVTPNEQYHAMETTDRNWRRFTDDERSTLTKALNNADFGPATSRRQSFATHLKSTLSATPGPN
ncbi:hypothetical protein [Actinoplanes couchii]|uniref:Uncharacterized protein n=1 Tax=Actinoplanes couchii TaxID=403638 RepID=A0ABQ3XKA2_9ACTN|nr:hypothetical protein [Actinoplanes couchii]MDR6320457.1 hypothetical protein [Actinoplanes couchii]GID58860.1 hypothetical protein Aco03nite_072640 [Actinoplanes couchii]